MFDPCPVQLRHQRGRKVQRRRRGCDRALLGGEHRLVILGILRIGRAACRDIGRQRHPTGALEQQLDRLVARKLQREAAIRAAIMRGRGNAIPEIDRIAVAQPSRVADEGAPAARSLALVQGRADPRITARALKLRRDDARIVEHQQIAWPQRRGQVADAAIVRGVAVEHEQARRIARHRRAQRDPLGRQFEVEQIDVHGRSPAGVGFSRSSVPRRAPPAPSAQASPGPASQAAVRRLAVAAVHMPAANPRRYKRAGCATD